MAFSVHGGTERRRPFCFDLPAVPGDPGHSCNDDGIRHGPLHQEEYSFRLPGTGAGRKQMAYHGVLCHRGQLCPADALFHRLLVDPSLFLPHGDRDFFVSNLVLPLIIAFIVCYGIISYF